MVSSVGGAAFGVSDCPQNGQFEGTDNPLATVHLLPQCVQFNKNPSFHFIFNLFQRQ